MKKYIVLFLLLFVFKEFSYSQNENVVTFNLLDSIKKMDYTNLNEDKIFMYSKMFLNYNAVNEKHIDPAINKASIPELIVMAETSYMQYDFDKCDNILEKLVSAEKRHRKKIPYINYIKTKLERAKKLINATDFYEVISCKIYDKTQIEKGIELPTSNGNIVLTFSIDSVSKQITPKSIHISGDDVKRVCAVSDSINNNKLEYQIYVDNKWVGSNVSMQDIGTNVSFPYLSNDGITVYFSKKDDAALGGYDLFMSRFDTDNSKFFSPSLMGMPYNSPENDYLMIYNQKQDITYLVTDRMLDNGLLSVIKLKQSKKDNMLSDSDIDKLKNYAILSDYKKYSSDENPDYVSSNEDECYFRVNSKILIRRLSDFKSSDARKCFKQSLDCMNIIRESEELLNEKIKIYRDTKDLETKKYIGAELEDYRNKIRVLRQEYNSLLVESKNYEIEYNKK